MKTCRACGRHKPFSEFNRRARSSDGLQARCRSCMRGYQAQWYADNKGRHRTVSEANKARRKKALVRKLLTWLESHPCTDCAERDPIVLEFDHVGDDKEANVGDLIRDVVPWTRVLEEIGKCEVVCSNCHRRRTARRNGSWLKQALMV